FDFAFLIKHYCCPIGLEHPIEIFAVPSKNAPNVPLGDIIKLGVCTMDTNNDGITGIAELRE
ncbi:hypothetical protein ACJX0J_014662, partial [Zea mays]